MGRSSNGNICLSGILEEDEDDEENEEFSLENGFIRVESRREMNLKRLGFHLQKKKDKEKVVLEMKKKEEIEEGERKNHRDMKDFE